jgi:PEGA domain-containing protein
MKGRAGVTILAALLLVAAAGPSAADRAVPRGGGGGSRGGGGGHHGGGGYARASGYRGGGGYAHGGGYAARPVTGAQYRHPRAGTGYGSYYGHGYYGGYGYRPYYGHGYRPYGYGYGYRPYYGYYPYYPYYSYPYAYGSYGWPFGLSLGFSYVSGGGSSYGGYVGGGPAYGGYAASAPSYAYGNGYEGEPAPYQPEVRATERTTDTGEVLLDVQPEDASVYVDDQFRGTGGNLRGLRLRAGRHRLEIVRPGYVTYHDEVVVEVGGRVTLQVVLDRN